MTRAEKARESLKAAVAEMASSEKASGKARSAWEKKVLDSYDAGLTYNEIAKISGKSKVRIDQVIRAERIRRGLPVATVS